MKSNNNGKVVIKVDESDIIDGSYQIPAGETSIGNLAFAECRNLQKIKFPAGVTNGKDNSFFHANKQHASKAEKEEIEKLVIRY
ncbi:Uncharacterised protein [Legionella beliardensis]|uniref:Leucine-rich repeat domain-containing protein n=1 Tax=Legionella beliardensis TaxID=91822 RepID=A0A378I609_9GAMM|nr:leucine-rich repeat protein [Legionella beliardensis]STX27904.1 Uncharacterised protein [Legionella beliardensis]